MKFTKSETRRKLKNKIEASFLAVILILMFFSSLSWVSAAYTVEEHSMPPESDDVQPLFAMKTKKDGCFYRPNKAIDCLKIEMLFDNQNIVGDQTGGTSPYEAIANYPDGIVDVFDSTLISAHAGQSEGDSNWNYMADINPDRYIDLFDAIWISWNAGKTGSYITSLSGVTVVFNVGGEVYPDSNGFVTIPQDATSFTVKRNGNSIGAMIIFYGSRESPIAYSTIFEFTVPDDGASEVWYYVLAKIYVPSELAGQGFYLFPESVNDWIRNVKMNSQLKYSGGHPACQPPASVSLGILGQGYHLLEFEFGEQWGYGILRFHVATGSGQYTWLSRFRVYVPNYTDAEVKYTVKTCTYFPYDQYFLVGYADNYISSVWVNTSQIWADWEWDMGQNYGALYAGESGFCYPLGYRESWRDVKFTFGEEWAYGLLDFQYVSRSNQEAKIGNPRFWTRVSTSEASSYLKIYESKAYIGSQWLGDVATSPYMTDTTVRVLVNATSDNPYYMSLPQEAQVSLLLYPLILQWPEPINYVDIGVIFNLTYTYYDENSLYYGMPIWFEPYSIEVKTPEQGSMAYIPETSLVFCTQSDTSFISPEWKIYLKAGATIASALLGTIVGYEAGSIIGEFWGKLIGGATGAASTIISGYYFEQDSQLNSTQEYMGTPSYRKFSMNAFKTTKEQMPLSPVVSNQSSTFFFRVHAWDSFHCGSLSIAMKGYLWLPFFYREPGHGPPDSPNWYGDWLPVSVEIETRFPIFIE
jgi:hypothetical protein